jgi:hypothetical protein
MCPSVTLSTTNLTWNYPSANPGLRGERIVANRLSYVMFIWCFPQTDAEVQNGGNLLYLYCSPLNITAHAQERQIQQQLALIVTVVCLSLVEIILGDIFVYFDIYFGIIMFFSKRLASW